MSIELLGVLGSIVLLDLVLSGDNALVLGAIAARLPRKQRLFAILFGGGMAIVFRIAFTITATLLLGLPLLQVLGAIGILWVAWHLLAERNHDENTLKKRARSTHLSTVILTITVADLSMSLDNILAIGALAAGNIGSIIFGLSVSIIILMLASALVAELIRLLPWLLDLASLVLAWTASGMILQDKMIAPLLDTWLPDQLTQNWIGSLSIAEVGLGLIFVLAMLGVDLLLRGRKKTNPSQA
ncbi:MAG TPA: YjbE family putative metal transport protein [Ktedonobacteraceae bacterium]|nr:YjbE family putative metal transport protein [Ktedonobacteraceae bacterium]